MKNLDASTKRSRSEFWTIWVTRSTLGWLARESGSSFISAGAVMDMQVLIQTLKDVGYPHMVVPDHAPQHNAPGHYEQAFAFQFGFIKAMMLTVK